MLRVRRDYSKIEDVSDDEIRGIIQTAIDTELPPIRPMPYLGDAEVITYEYPELVARCPMTGILDTYKVTIRYTPNEWLSELKSLKFYFLGYDQMRIGHEHLCFKIKKDFQEAVQPQKLEVLLQASVRGGITTTVVAEYKRK